MKCQDRIEMKDGAYVVRNCTPEDEAEMDAKLKRTEPGKREWLPPGHTIRGVGDVVKRVTDFMGIKQCGGCRGRQDVLNKLLPNPFTRP